ncbi:polysaccharide deacetylase family protein [Nocardioides zeae]|uniref:Peptidoglycan/xylan/chitin deacetylase (PgdA/CDA1 family) n=1 Tax=Nocardioides zeae TaxID=1457234 RepID=A0AAJ1U6C5_9ACTN|nr:polysaccharide deacetylase family protein [Nocardioides zeae]MDQ1106398.1 peptidoglycan/xylan/chitin deacetylase (PgdA/CDA1 family) [Nocardioides zeae]
MSRRALVALLAVGALVTGCSDDVATEPDQPHELAPSQPPVDTTAVTVDGYPAVVDPSVLEDVPAASTVTVTEQQGEVHVTWPRLGIAALDAELDRLGADEVAAFRPTVASAPEDSELNGTWSFVGSSGDMVGVLTDTFRLAEGSSVETWQTTWYDAAAGTVVPNGALVDDPAALAEDVTEALDGQPAVDVDLLATALTTGVPVLGFTENGELFVGFDEGQISPAHTGRVSVVLTLDQTDDLLSDLGEVAQASLVDPTLPPGAVDPGAVDPGAVDPGAEETEGAEDTEDRATSTPPVDTGDVDCAVQQCVALTFDDGPGAGTPALLDALGTLDAPATFFVLGQQVATYPGVTAAIAAAGHELGVHTWDHRNLTRLPLTEVDRELARTVTVVEDVVDQTPTLFRPPYGATDERVRTRADAAGLSEVLPTVDPDTLAGLAPAALVERVVAGAEAGGIVVLPDTATTSAATVTAIVTGLRQRGFTLVTASRLLDSTGDAEDGDGPGDTETTG